MRTIGYTPLSSDCPRKGCGAKAGSFCKDRSGRDCKPHAARLNGALLKPLSDKQIRYIAGLRRELGVEVTELPETSREGARLIKALIARRDAKQRSDVRRQAAAASPSAEVLESIAATADRLGVEVRVPTNSADAGFMLDDLRHRERKARRVADGSRS